MEGRKIQFVKNTGNSKHDDGAEGQTESRFISSFKKSPVISKHAEETVQLPCKTESDVTTFTKNQTHISETLPRVSVKLLAVEVRSQILLLTTLIFFTLYSIDLLLVRQSSKLIQHFRSDFAFVASN